MTTTTLQTRRRPLRAGFAATLAVVLAGCGGGDGGGGKASASSPAVERLCGEASVPAHAGEALELILDAKRVDIRDDASTLADAVEEADSSRPHTTIDGGQICALSSSPASGGERVSVFWALTAKPKEALEPKFTVLPMGEQAGAAWDSARLTFGCADDGDAPGASPDHVTVSVRTETDYIEPSEKTKVLALKNAYATVAHTFALAMARAMGCRDDAGLPAEPVLKPA
ncbi:hypothetical protein [Streptomyces zhihengii]